MSVDTRIQKILVIITLDFLGYMILFPIIPFKISQLGGSPLTYGLLLTAYAVCQLASAPLLGLMSDKTGPRIPLMISFTGTLLAFIVIYYSSSIDILIAAVVLDGLTSGNIPLPQAMLSHFSSSNNRTSVFAMSGICISACILVGPLITAITNKINPSIPVLIAIIMVTLNLIFVLLFVPKKQATQKSATPFVDANENTNHGWKQKLHGVLALKLLFFIYILFQYSSVHFNTGFAMFAKNQIDFFGRKVGTNEYAYLLSYAACFSILTQYFFLPRLLKIASEINLVLIGFLLNILAYILFFISTNQYTVFAALPLIAFSVGLIKPCLISTVSKQDSFLKVGALMGTFQSLSSVVLIIVPLISGKLLKAEFYSIWILTPVSIGIVATLASYFQLKKQKRFT